MWVMIYAFTVNSSGHVLNYAGLGALLLILLFQGSMRLSESITLSKYPPYEDYKLSTSMCWPMPKRGRRRGPKKYE